MGASRTEEILKGGTLSVNDTSIEPHTVEERAALQAAGIGAYICPLLIKDGRFVGAFGIHSRSPRVWTPDEIALAEEVADRIWATVEHHKAEAELRANEERLAFLLRLNDALRPLERPCRRPGNARHGCSPSTSTSPVSATPSSKAVDTSSVTSTRAEFRRWRDAHCREHSVLDCARPTSEAKRPSSTTSRRIRGSRKPSGPRCRSVRSPRSSA